MLSDDKCITGKVERKAIHLVEGQRKCPIYKHNTENQLELQREQLQELSLHELRREFFWRGERTRACFPLGDQKRVRNYATNCSARGGKMTEITTDAHENGSSASFHESTDTFV